MELAESDSGSSLGACELTSEWDYGDSENTHLLQELRIVLLGTVESEKSSAGNTILGREEFDSKKTAQCVKRQGEVAGRHITVVKAPAWWSNKTVEDCTELLKQEIVLSVSLYPPGPHALLLVIDVDSVFTEKDSNILKGYVNLLGERVWNYTIMLFTSVECLGDRTIEQYIESEGKALQWLVEKCGDRYHVLNNKIRSDDTQVTELLEKIEEMVVGNDGHHFEMDRRTLLELGHRRREEDRRAKEKMMMVQKQRQDIRLQMGNNHHLSELRVVLLGYINAGRSAVGNTILGREEFNLDRATQCLMKQGEDEGRHITVVEAPGWWSNRHVEECTKLLKQEIALSVSLCPPGPHAVLVVLALRFNFQESDRKVLEGYMGLLGDKVWSHTIVVFTYGDWLGTTTVEHFIESEGRALQWLIEKCGNRYHVLNNENRGDKTQAIELLKKIEELVAANSGRHFDMSRSTSEELKERRVEEERAKQRMMKVQKQRQAIRAQIDDTHHLSEMRIVLLGYINAGRSSSGNTILGREDFDLKRTTQCVKRQGEVAGRHITVVEAPGWWSNRPIEKCTELLKQEIVLSVSLCPPGPQTVLLVVALKFDFKESDRRVLEGYLMLLGEKAWNHTIVLFTYGDNLGNRTIEQYIECEGKALQWLVEKCGNRYHVLNNKNRSDNIQLTELLEKIEEMVAANGGCHFEIDRKILQEVEEKRRAEEERAKERMMKVQQQRENLKVFMELRKRRKGGAIILGAEKLNTRSRSMPAGTSIESHQREWRQPSPVPSYLSMKSDGSIDLPPVFTGESAVSVPREWRQPSPVPSYLSMKSDGSIDLPPVFTGESSVSVQSHDHVPLEPLMEDYGACCVCKDPLKDPLSIQCGFCSQCSEIYWPKSGLAVNYPECGNTNLAPNEEDDDDTRKLQQASPSPSSSAYGYTGAADVFCDFCCGMKCKAVKLCLTCTASYCETHVKEHYTIAALQRHILVEATEDIEQKLCQVHRRALEVFCKTDKTHICLLCLAFEHRGHDIEVKSQPAAVTWKKAVDVSALTADKKYLKKILFIGLFFLIFVVILYYALMRGNSE